MEHSFKASLHTSGEWSLYSFFNRTKRAGLIERMSVPSSTSLKRNMFLEALQSGELCKVSKTACKQSPSHIKIGKGLIFIQLDVSFIADSANLSQTALIRIVRRKWKFYMGNYRGWMKVVREIRPIEALVSTRRIVLLDLPFVSQEYKTSLMWIANIYRPNTQNI